MTDSRPARSLVVLDVADLLTDCPPWQVAVVERLRRLMAVVLPEAVEKVYPGWRAIGYRHPAAGYIGGIFPTDQGVRLLFEHGASLPDPSGVLEGEIKQVRWITFEDSSAVTPELESAIGQLLLEAVDFRTH